MNKKRAVFLILIFAVIAVVIAVDYYEIRQRREAYRKEEIKNLLDMGMGYFNNWDYEAAQNCFDKVLEIDPENVTAWLGKGTVYYMTGDYDKALKCSDKVIELNPAHPDAWMVKGHTYFMMKDYEKAIECYDRAIELDPELEGSLEKYRRYAIEALSKTRE